MTSRAQLPDMIITAKLAGTVVAKTFVQGPTDAATASAAAGNSIGVAEIGGVSGDYISVVNQGVAIVTAGAAIAANALVEVNASGQAVTKAAGVAVGRLFGGAVAAAGQDCQVNLFLN